MAGKKVKREAKKITFDGVIADASRLLSSAPFALEIENRVVDGRNQYTWQDQSIKARGVRAKIRKMLKTLWQSGGFNYDQIATSLRVDSISVFAILDDEWREKHGIK